MDETGISVETSLLAGFHTILSLLKITKKRTQSIANAHTRFTKAEGSKVLRCFCDKEKCGC